MMKAKILLAVCLALAGISAAKAQNGVGTVLLHHEGNVTVYWGNDIQSAVDASVKGDTLYLSEGQFLGFKLQHGVVVIGSGEKTLVTQDIRITGDENKMDLDGYEFSGLNLSSNDFMVGGWVKGFRMSQCQMRNFTLYDCSQFEEANVVMNYITSTCTLGSAAKNITFTNSKIGRVYHFVDSHNSVTLYHCNVGTNSSNSTYPTTYYGCIIDDARGATTINSLHYSGNSPTFSEESWKESYNSHSDLNGPYSDEELREKGYICSDGTVVGITGGSSPYTLELAVPHVTDHKIDVDNVSRTVKVTLKMSGNANGN